MKVWESSNKLIKKEVLSNGIFSKKPTELSVCTIHVQNPTLSGLSMKQIKNDFYSDILDEDSLKIITLGEADSEVDRYLERAIETMSLNEHSLISVKIPTKNSNMVTTSISLEITLKSVEFYKPIWEWTPAEKYQVALTFKIKGVELFKKKRFVDAFHRFGKACKTLLTLEPLDDIKEYDEQLFKNIHDLKYILYNNMAECQLLKENYEHVLTLCTKVLSKEEKNIKALYRRGVAYGNLKNYEKAIEDLKVVIELNPDDKKTREKLNTYSEKWSASVQKYENIVRKMFRA